MPKCLFDNCNNEICSGGGGWCRKHCDDADKFICSGCKTIKSRDGFYTSLTDKRVSPCIECRNKLNSKRQYSLTSRYNSSKHRAIKDGREWTLTLEEYEQKLSSGKCHYCSYPLSKSGKGLDRKDSSQGYTEQNCVACCSICNNFGSDFWSYEEKKFFGEMIKSKLDERSKVGLPVSFDRSSLSQRRGPRGDKSFIGVTKDGNVWRARIRVNGTKKNIGTFDTPEEAAKNYDFYALQVYGKECHLNFPIVHYESFTPKRQLKFK